MGGVLLVMMLKQKMNMCVGSICVGLEVLSFVMWVMIGMIRVFIRMQLVVVGRFMFRISVISCFMISIVRILRKGIWNRLVIFFIMLVRLKFSLVMVMMFMMMLVVVVVMVMLIMLWVLFLKVLISLWVLFFRFWFRLCLLWLVKKFFCMNIIIIMIRMVFRVMCLGLVFGLMVRMLIRQLSGRMQYQFFSIVCFSGGSLECGSLCRLSLSVLMCVMVSSVV